MLVHLKKFVNHSAYETAESSLEKPNVSLCMEENEVHYNPIVVRMDIITYEASSKLNETTGGSPGLHIDAFNTTIKSHTFENGVGTIEFNADVTSMGNNAFGGCFGLTSIILPESVTSIGDYAFDDCSELISVIIKATTPPTLGSTPFNNNASGRKIYVPSASVAAYQAASGWSTYASDIRQISQ